MLSISNLCKSLSVSSRALAGVAVGVFISHSNLLLHKELLPLLRL